MYPTRPQAPKDVSKEKAFIILLTLLSKILTSTMVHLKFKPYEHQRWKYFCTRFWKQSIFPVSQQANKIFFLWLIKRRMVLQVGKKAYIPIEVLFYFTHDFNQRRQWHPTPVLCLENPMDGGAWLAAVHGVSKSRTRLKDFTFTFHFHALEKEMATHSSVLAWRIPGTGEPGGCRLWGHTESDTTEVI